MQHTKDTSITEQRYIQCIGGPALAQAARRPLQTSSLQTLHSIQPNKCPTTTTKSLSLAMHICIKAMNNIINALFVHTPTV